MSYGEAYLANQINRGWFRESERTMRVLVAFTIDTSDYGEKEFRREIEKLVSDIDNDSKVVDFAMAHVSDKYKIRAVEMSRFSITK